MTSTTDPTILDSEAPSISACGDKLLTVAEYDAVQRQGRDQPLWARRVPPVEQLTEEPSWPYDVHVVDRPAYNAQMRHLIGLD